MRATVRKIQNHHFSFSIRGMTGEIDVEAEGTSAGPNPKELTLAALCGCTGTDMVDLLKKFSFSYSNFSLEARGTITESHPKVFQKIDLKYIITSEDPKTDKAVEAAKRSTHQYSGMAAMLSRVCPIEYVVEVNGVVVEKDFANFSKDTTRPT